MDNAFITSKAAIVVTTLDHPIFLESIRFIQSRLGRTGLEPLEQKVLERLIHSSGDFALQHSLAFTSASCHQGLRALQGGAYILTDTQMAASAVTPMASRTLKSSVRNALDWASDISLAGHGSTRTAIGMKRAWLELTSEVAQRPSPVVLIGSSPSALQVLLDLVSQGAPKPSLIIGMPVGFIGVSESKERLSNTDLPQIRLEGSRGGAALAAATVNALLRASIESGF